MRALIVTGPNKLELADIAKPEINDYQALVRIDCCGICSSTDWKLIKGQMPWAPAFPISLGHESVGRVVETGKRVKKFSEGDQVTRVVVPGNGTVNSAFGGFAEYGVVTDAEAMAADGDDSLLEDYVALRQVIAPSNLSPVEAALVISLSETASALIRLPNLRDKRVLVAGTGVAGLAFCLWCKMAGAHVTCLGRRDERLELAKDIAADQTVNTNNPDWQNVVQEVNNGKVDGIIEAIGNVDFAATLKVLVKEGGFLSAYGAPPDGQSYGVDWTNMKAEEHRCYSWVSDLIERKWINPDWFISHVWPFDEVIHAFDEVRQGNVLKGFIKIPG